MTIHLDFDFGLGIKVPAFITLLILLVIMLSFNNFNSKGNYLLLRDLMVNYWVFVIGGTRPGRDIFENPKKFKKLLEKNPYWGLSTRTPYLEKLTKDDKGVFYLAGPNGQKFLASFELDSETCKLTERKKSKLNKYLVCFCRFCVNIKEIKFFKKQVSILPLITTLYLTRGKSSYGATLQGGIRRIIERDYKKILERSK